MSQNVSVPLEVEYDWNKITVSEIVRVLQAVPGVVRVTELAIGFRTENSETKSSNDPDVTAAIRGGWDANYPPEDAE